MRIGRLAESTGLSRDTIRYYERQGLIESSPGASRTNSYRDYGEDLVGTLGFIADAREAGFSIADLKELRGAIGANSSDNHARHVLRNKIEELEVGIETSRRVIRYLEMTIKRLDAHAG